MFSCVSTLGEVTQRLRDARYKYYFYGDGCEVFYDLDDADREVIDRAAEPAYEATIQALRRRLLTRLMQAQGGSAAQAARLVAGDRRRDAQLRVRQRVQRCLKIVRAGYIPPARTTAVQYLPRSSVPSQNHLP